MVNKFKYPLV